MKKKKPFKKIAVVNGYKQIPWIYETTGTWIIEILPWPSSNGKSFSFNTAASSAAYKIKLMDWYSSCRKLTDCTHAIFFNNYFIILKTYTCK